MIGERSILLLSAVMLSVSAVALGVAAPYHVHAAQAGVRVAAGQDDEAMRKQLRKLGVPESEIDKTLKQLNEKLEEKGVSEGQRKYVMTLKERPVKIHMKWTAEVRPAVKSVAFRCGKKQGGKGGAHRQIAGDQKIVEQQVGGSDQGRNPIGVAVIKSSIEQIEELVGNDDERVFVIDPQGVVFVSNRPDWLYHTLGKLSPEKVNPAPTSAPQRARYPRRDDRDEVG